MAISAPVLRVLIVEDHSLLAEGIRNLLSTHSRYEVVGEVTNGLDVYGACIKLTPDIVLLDLNLPGMDGVEIITQLHRRWEKLRIVVLTASTTEQRGQEALTAGAHAYVLKQSPRQILLTAMQQVSLDKIYIDPTLRLDTSTPTNSINKAVLTPRERQILKLIAEGKRNRDISELLTISLKTVETHRLNLMRKLDAHNAAELSNWARRLGICDF